MYEARAIAACSEWYGHFGGGGGIFLPHIKSLKTVWWDGVFKKITKTHCSHLNRVSATDSALQSQEELFHDLKKKEKIRQNTHTNTTKQHSAIWSPTTFVPNDVHGNRLNQMTGKKEGNILRPKGAA